MAEIGLPGDRTAVYGLTKVAASTPKPALADVGFARSLPRVDYWKKRRTGISVRVIWAPASASWQLASGSQISFVPSGAV